MRFLSLAVLALIFTAPLLRAQSMAAPTAPTAPAPPPPADAWMVSFLTPDQRVEYAQAHAKALADNPGLKEEGDTLKAQAVTVLKDGTPADKQAFMEKMTTHRQKLRAAMLKEDPNLSPVFTLIDNALSKAKAKGAAPGQ
jgi:hypothetical protein